MTDTITPAVAGNTPPLDGERPPSSAGRAVSRDTTSNSVTHVAEYTIMIGKTAEQRAEAAAEELAAEGLTVTARAVRGLAHVETKVAAAAARAWNAREAQAGAVPAMPKSLVVRMEGLWREAVQTARVEHQAERDGWAANLKTVEDERDEAFDEVTGIQNELVLAANRIAELEKTVQKDAAAAEQVRKTLAEAEARAAKAQAATAAAEGVASGLREALAAVQHKDQRRAAVDSGAGVGAPTDDTRDVTGPLAGTPTASTPSTPSWQRP